ncbi:TIGR02678 family protein [Streptomyces sp. NPDC050704]|uniref:TIGR02678 family protein n=1 Tax=Streptomyces sp. NPDC050704 TaxID=3157219 RepID=UPI0034409096
MTSRSREAAFERSQIIRALLLRPLLHRRGRHIRTLDLARRHQAELRRWFDHHLGWQLHVERDHLRLFKIPEAPDRQGIEAPTARQSALYCLLLAVLEDCGQQTVISELAEKLTAVTATHTALRRFDATAHRERFDLVAMVRLLCRHGILAPTGDAGTAHEHEKQYVAGSGDALYDVDHRTAALMLAAPVAPAQATGPDELFDALGAEQGRTANELTRQALMRRLVDEPVVHLYDLPGDQRDYFLAHTDEVLTAVRLGLDTRVEVRAEGAAVIDEELTDLEFPKASAPSFAALVLADRLCGEVESRSPRRTFVSHPRLFELTADVAADLLQLITTINGHPIDAIRVKEAALPVLVQLGLAEHVSGGIRVRPAIARYRAMPGLGTRKGAENLMLFGAHDLPSPSARSSEDGSDDTL